MRTHKFSLIAFLLLWIASPSLATCISIHDIDVLPKGEKAQIRTLVGGILSNLKVDGKEICLQIDFFDELPSQENGFTEEGRRIFSPNYYDRWFNENNQSPAALILFLKEGENYQLESFLVNGLLEEKVPGLVSRFIHDEIMRKKTGYGQIIEAGMKALAKALDPIYLERLKTEHLKLFSGNQYKRRHAWDQAIPMNYYAFEPTHSGIPTPFGKEIPELQIVDNDVYFDWSDFTYVNTETIVIPQGEKEGYWYEDVLFKQFNTPVLRDIIKHPRTASENIDLITAQFKKDLIEIAKDPAHQDLDHTDFDIVNLLSRSNLFSPSHPPQYRWSILGCRVKVKKLSLDKAWDYIPDVINRAIYPNTGFQGPTWCNQYARDLSTRIYGEPIFGSMSANDLYDDLSSNPNFIKLESKENPWKYINRGFTVLFSHHGGRRPGHVETGLPAGTTTINPEFQTFTTENEDRFTVGAGSIMGSKDYYSEDSGFKGYLYLGFLKE